MKEIRLRDDEYPRDPVDAILQDDGMLILEGEDGESVALSQLEVRQLIEWLSTTSQKEEEEKKLQEWNMWASTESIGRIS